MSRLMLIVVIGLAAFGVAAAVLHFLVEPYNSGFAEYSMVTWTHVVLGALYLAIHRPARVRVARRTSLNRTARRTCTAGLTSPVEASGQR